MREASAPGRVTCCGPLTEQSCASTSSISICRTTGSRCARQSRATRRGCWWSSPARVRGPHRSRPAVAARSRRRAGLQRHQGHSGAVERHAPARRGVAQIDATLHMRIAADRWLAFMRPAKRLAAGDRINFGHDGNACFLGHARCHRRRKGRGRRGALAFDLAGAFLDEAMQAVGHMPLPPYIASKRPDDERDRTDYQTIYAREEGAVAAPTAGLHFTPELFAALDARGIERAFRDAACRRRHLPAGQGRRHGRPQDARRDRAMFRQRRRPRVNAARARGNRVVAVGTTSLRLLESAAREDGTLARMVAARPTSSSRRATASGSSMR